LIHAVRFATIALSLVAALAAQAKAGTVHGTVKNSTVGKPAAGIEVILIQLQAGMQQVANTKTDGSGQFSFDHPTLGVQPMLVRVVFKGVNFHQPVPPGKSDIQVEVFEPTPDAKTIVVPSHIVILQPNGTSLTAWGPSGMPVVQATIDKTKNRYAIAYAFRPGESGMRYSYELPYAGNAATVRLPTVYPGARLLVLAPPTVQVVGDGLQPGGQEQGMNIYGRDSVPAGTEFALNVSGTAPPAGSRGDTGQEAQAGAPAGVTVQQIPGRLDVLKWPLICGFIGLFALGAILLARKPVVAVAGVGGTAVDLAEPSSPGAKKVVAVQAGGSTMGAAAPTLADMDAVVGLSLDSLKDQIFRLELRRQAGTISEEDYAQERARAEKVLRDLVRG
jgi:hypothetical protein